MTKKYSQASCLLFGMMLVETTMGRSTGGLNPSMPFMSKEKMEEFENQKEFIRLMEARGKEMDKDPNLRRRDDPDFFLQQQEELEMEDILLGRAIPLKEYEARLHAAGAGFVPDEAAAKPSGSVPEFMKIKTAPESTQEERDLVYNGWYYDDDYSNAYQATNDGNQNDGNQDANGDDYYYLENIISFSSYSLKYATCQPVQHFSSNAVENGEYSALVTDDVVVLRLCPTRTCSEDSYYGCRSGFGEYAMSVSDYLNVMMKYQLDKTTNACKFCKNCKKYYKSSSSNYNNDNYNNDNYNRDLANDDTDDYFNNNNNNDGGNDDGGTKYNNVCYTYQDICQTYLSTCNYNANRERELEENGYDDAYLATDEYANYFYCAQMEDYWVNPHCDTKSRTIQMGLFYDPFCSQFAGDDIDVNSYSDVSFKSDIFSDFYAGSCISCSTNKHPPFYNANAYMCNKIYSKTAKCNTYLSYDLDGNGNSDESEEVVCSFIESIRDGTYGSDGEIYVKSSQDNSSIPPKVTSQQKQGLIISAAVVAILAMYSCYLHHSITSLLLQSIGHSQLVPGESNRRRRRSGSRRRSRGRSKDAKSVSSRHDSGGGSVGDNKTCKSQKTKERSGNSRRGSENDWDFDTNTAGTMA
eukprot:CAMPEP_0198282932 /NCGR_PEP_ID=MMETSP1449-20131203/2633_1 /TAXON_ID=420275 /ORGANISM="Attheya septentrionalis, Strain CCMP2084" /LENGTH=636 /DNA_ID=CAMNT_0043979351 /DNA_START=94 /DNA_END=2004 /DNA_ORIENTATION=-